jgi:D-amino-acid dehydrogenase
MIRRTSPLVIRPGLDFRRLLWLLNFAGKCTAEHLQHAIQAREKILQHSKLLYESLFEDENLDGDFENKGVLMVFKSESGWQDHGRGNEYLKPYGMEAEPIVGEALFKLEPSLRPDVYGAWHQSIGGHLRPDTFVQEWKKLLIDNGAVIEEDCRLQHFDTSGAHVDNAITNKGAFAADTYILATGAWTPQITRQLHLTLPIQAAKGYSITTERPAVSPNLPCYLYESSVVATPWKSGFRVGGTLEFSGFNSVIDQKRIQHLKTTVRKYLNVPLPETAVEEWVGMRPMTYDDLPIIDRAPAQHNLFVASGHGMLGISMAPGTGRLVAEMITGSDCHIDPSPYRIGRFS